jgi:hypothetical protein
MIVAAGGEAGIVRLYNGTSGQFIKALPAAGDGSSHVEEVSGRRLQSPFAQGARATQVG